MENNGYVNTLKNPCKAKPIVTGRFITKEAVHGRTGIMPEKYSRLDQDTVTVLREADITFFPLISQAKGVIIEEGTLAGHFSQMLREMNMPALVGAKNAIRLLDSSQDITLFPLENGSGGVVGGSLELKKERLYPDEFPKTKTKIYTLCSFEKRIKQLKNTPLAGVGLIRSEFLNSFMFGIHPQAIIDYVDNKLEDDEAKKQIDALFNGVYGGKVTDPKKFYIEKVAEAINDIAVHIPGKRINYRFSDLRSDDSGNLIGGRNYEPEENNPMMGWRGTSKLIDEEYRSAFYMECEIIKTVIEKYGIDIHVLTPFCRTCEDGEELVNLIRGYGLDKPEIGMMVEMPSNVVMADEFASIFDFFLVGPMDLTQSTYMSNRESAKLEKYCDINQKGTKAMVKTMLQNLQNHQKEIWIGEYEVFCGLEDYLRVAGDNTLHLVCLPDKIEGNFFRVRDLEKRLGI